MLQFNQSLVQMNERIVITKFPNNFHPMGNNTLRLRSLLYATISFNTAWDESERRSERE